MVAIPPTHPPTTANPAPEQQRSTPHTPRHAHAQPHHRSIRRRHLDTTRANGGFTTIDTSPRRVAGVSHPYGRNSPHAPTHNRQPRHHSMSCLREVQTISKSPDILPMPSLTRLTTGGVLNPLKNTTKIGHNKLLHQEPLQPPLELSNRQPRTRATTQHPAHPAPRPYTTSPPQHSQTPPRHHPRLSVNPSCAHTHTRTRCHPPHVQPPPQRRPRPRPPPNPSCKRVPNHGLVPHIMAFTCNN